MEVRVKFLVFAPAHKPKIHKDVMLIGIECKEQAMLANILHRADVFEFIDVVSKSHKSVGITAELERVG